MAGVYCARRLMAVPKDNPMLNEQEQKFLATLRGMCRMYGVYIQEYTSYDGEENYTGSTFVFQGPNVHIEIDRKTVPQERT